MRFSHCRFLPFALLLFGCGSPPASSNTPAAEGKVEGNKAADSNAADKTTAGKKGIVPRWVQEELPESVCAYLGRAGLPVGWHTPSGPLAPNVGAIDHWQANHFIVYRPETAKFLDESYTPTTVDHHPGLLPAMERIVAQYTTAGQSDRDKALALLTKALADHFKHPTIPPVGPKTPPNRNLEDEALLASGCGWCNEQSRVYVRLCQIAGIPARMIYLFYDDDKSGHVVSEFFADGHWSMADSSYLCVFPEDILPDGSVPSPSGRLLSAAELHTPEGKAIATRVYRARWKEIMQSLADQSEPGQDKGPSRGGSQRPVPRNLDHLSSFGVLNYPLPSMSPTH